MLFVAVAMLALLGCGRSGNVAVPLSLGELAPSLIERHGNLYFVKDPEAGYQVAASQGMPCLLFFTAEWCTYCRQMEATAFTDNTVGELADDFVCLLVDADREPELCRHFRVSGFPTIQFVAPDGQMLHRLVGRQTATNLAAGMRAASSRYAWITGRPNNVR